MHKYTCTSLAVLSIEKYLYKYYNVDNARGRKPELYKLRYRLYGHNQ